jgi:uncharacterized protein
MKVKVCSFRLWSAMGLLWAVAGAWAQSSAPAATQSIATLKKQAASGNPQAQFQLAMKYYRQDNNLAFFWCRKAAMAGDPDAQQGLGVFYDVGIGVAQDHAEAVTWFRKAADQGFALAQYALGSAYETGGGVAKDPAQAAVWYRKAADQGFALAQYALGFLYDVGEGVLKDGSEAAKLYLEAANQGDADAQFGLGQLYENGDGVPQDYAEALRLYRKLAEQGDARGQFSLGAMYYNGTGVPQDYEEAYFWANLAAAQNTRPPDVVEFELKTRDEFATKLSPVQLAQVQERCRKWLEGHPALTNPK